MNGLCLLRLSQSLWAYKWMVETLLCDCPFPLVALKLLICMKGREGSKRKKEKLVYLVGMLLLFLKGKRDISAIGDASARCGRAWICI